MPIKGPDGEEPTRYYLIGQMVTVGVRVRCSTPPRDTRASPGRSSCAHGRHPGRVSAIEHANAGATELRTLAAYVEALGGRLEIIADFGDEWLAFTQPSTEAA